MHLITKQFLKKALILCQGFLFYSVSSSAQGNPSDTIIQRTAPTLEVSAFSFTLKSLKQPSAIQTLSVSKIGLSDHTSFQNALNTVPGVYFESRGNGGSPRLNIRGSMFRSPFGVRNVRMYWEDFVLTSPDGTTPIEVIDPNWIHSMDIIKGPSSVQYGNSTGGVIQMKSLNIPKLSYVKVKQLVGQWGTFQQHFTVSTPIPALFSFRFAQIDRQINIFASQSGTHGYREQEANARKQVLVVLRKTIKAPLLAWRFDGKFKAENISVFQWYQGGWQLPGSLNQQEFDQNPRQARPYSVNNNASLYRHRWMYGTGQNRTWNNFSLTWRAAVNGIYKVNPFGTSPMNQGYKDEKSSGSSALIRLNQIVLENNYFSWQLSAGGESQWEDYHINEYVNVLGRPGNAKYDFNVHYLQYFYYLNSQWRWKENWVVQIGAAQHTTNAEVNGRYGTNEEAGDIKWNPGITPRWAVSYSPWSWLSIYSSSSTGFSNPNAFEQVDFQNNRYNSDLRPERGRQLEWGAKWEWSAFEGEVTHYNQHMTNLIVPASIQTESPLSYVNNASGILKGWEVKLGKKWELEKHVWDISLSGHKADYEWTEYAGTDKNWNGKSIAGNALHAASGVIQYQYNDEWLIDLSNYWVDQMPLNNDNTVFSHAYNLTNLKLSQVTNGNQMKWKWELGVNNLFNTSYTSFWQWNDSNARYFNPAPTRNFYFAVTAYLLK
jgi:iron complex outermembrane receptor protein